MTSLGVLCRLVTIFIIRMKSHKNKFLTTVAAAALVLAVGACSSGDDDGITAERDTALEELKAAQAKVTSLTEELSTATTNLATATESLTTANARVTELEGELATAMTDLGTASARVTELEGELATAMTDLGASSARVTELEGELATARTDLATAMTNLTTVTQERDDAIVRAETAETKLAEAEDDVAAAEMAKMLADRIAREARIQTAITNSVTTQGTDVNAFPSDITSVTATRNAAGMVAVKVSDEDYTGGETTAGSGDWNGVTLTNGTNTLAIYTDIEAPSDVLFLTQYATVENFLKEGQVGKAASGHFPTAASATWDYTGATDERPKSFRGSYDGVPGVFKCTIMDTCMLSTNAKGELIATTQVWDFTPDAPNAAMVKDPDAAYAHFGWWLNKPEDNTERHMTEVFAGGTTGHGANVTFAIEGNATYVGPAAGKYATKSFTAGVQTDAGVGHFTASTTLTAKFGDDSDAGMIGGSVTGFELDDGATPTWSVKLEDATLNNGAATFNGMTEATFGPTAKVPGVWEGSFFNDADTDDDANAPGTVVGTFSAVSTNASLLGAFGATKR